MKTSPVTDPLICDSREAFLEWIFSSISETMKVEMTKCPYGLGPLRTDSLEKGHDKWRKCCSQDPQPVQLSARRLHLAGSDQKSILTSHKAKLSRHNTGQKENTFWAIVLLFMSNDNLWEEKKISMWIFFLKVVSVGSNLAA